MKTTSAIRFFAKAGRLKLLRHLLEHPRRRFTINELARETHVPVSSGWRTVQDLSDLGLLLTERVGKAVVVQLNERSPATRALASLEFPDPQLMAYDAFARTMKRKIPGAEVRLFGSVSKGTSLPSSDVDVLVAYAGSGRSKREVEEACAQSSISVLDEFRIVVSPLIVARAAAIAP